MSVLCTNMNRDWLYQQYIVEGKSSREIAKEIGKNYKTILYHLKKYNIPIRDNHLLFTQFVKQKGRPSPHKGKKFPQRCGLNNPNYGNGWSEEQKIQSSNKRKRLYEEHPEIKDKIRENHWCNNPQKKKEIIEKHSRYMANLISEGKIQIDTGYKVGYFISIKMNDKFYFMSSYELIRFQQLENDDTVKSFTNKHGIKIPYYYNNKNRNYIPDILIEYKNGVKVLEEIKGFIRDKNIFDKKKEVAEKYCLENNLSYRLVFKKDL